MTHIKLFEEHKNEFTFKYVHLLQYYFSKYFITPEKATEIMKSLLLGKDVKIDWMFAKSKTVKIWDVEITRMGNSKWPLYTTIVTISDNHDGHTTGTVSLKSTWELPSNATITIYNPSEFSDEVKKMFREVEANKTGIKFDL